jgi:iron complex transport system ATP-binding protein
MSGAPALAATGLQFHQRGRVVLGGVTLTVQPGEVLGVLGPNGAGKSTLLRVLAGLWTASAGTVTLSGRPLSGWSRREVAQRAALVPQDLPGEGGFTAGEVVLMGRAPHQGRWALDTAQDREKALACLAEVGLGGLADRPLAGLSGGERRRVAVARALCQAPAVLLLDEPTAFLDVGAQLQVMETARARARAGVAVVAVLHDVELARGAVDRALLLAPGQPAEDGPAGALLTADRLGALLGVRWEERLGLWPVR